MALFYHFLIAVHGEIINIVVIVPVGYMLELFSGSGTGYDVCKDMGIQYVGADLNPIPVRPGILNINAVTDEVPADFFDADMLFMHPPYGEEIHIPYAGAEWGAEKKWTKVNGKNKCEIIDHTDGLIPQLGYGHSLFNHLITLS